MQATVVSLRAEGREALIVAEAVEIFFERMDIAEGTARKYRHTLGCLVERHGQRSIAAVGTDELTEMLEELSGQATGQTWNRHRAGLWRNRGTARGNVVRPLRERNFWRLASDTAARADDLLNLNSEDLDLQNRSAAVVGKGGQVRWVRWTTGTNRLMRELIGGRTRGPLFVTERRPTGDVATADRDPDNGRARLSYRRAHELFEAPTGGRWTLH